MTDAQPNPPWVDRVLNANWPGIMARFGDMVPVYEQRRGKIRPQKELGCGHYGCVLPTAHPGIVFKVTSDATEAAFVTAASSLKEWPEGMVRYYGIYQVPDESYRRRPVYVLTRQEAEDVGNLLAIRESEYVQEGESRDSKRVRAAEQDWFLRERVFKRLKQFKDYAAFARDRIVKSTNPRRAIEETEALQAWAEDVVDWDEVSRGLIIYPHHSAARIAAYAVRACHILAEEMTNEDVGYLIGGALSFYLDQGMLLADVHLNNVGRIKLEDHIRPVWAITDPGHMVPLDVQWLDLAVPVL